MVLGGIPLPTATFAISAYGGAHRAPEAIGEGSGFRSGRVCACVCLCMCTRTCVYSPSPQPARAAAWRLVPDRCRRASFPLAVASSSALALPLPPLLALAGIRRGACRPARPSPPRARPRLIPPSPSPRRCRAIPSSGTEHAGSSPGARSPAALALVTPAPRALGGGGVPGEGARGGTGWGGAARQPPRLPSRSLARSRSGGSRGRAQMRVRLAGGGGGGGKEAACMRPTGKSRSPEGACLPGEARAGRPGRVGSGLSTPEGGIFKIKPQLRSHKGLGQ